MNTAVVVGGGITGLISALQLKKYYEEVVLIEKASQVGGLLGSFYNADGVAFDFGTHYVAETGNTALDNMLLQGINNSSDWFELAKLPTASYFAGQLNEFSNCINTHFLSRPIYERGLLDIMSLEKPATRPANVSQQLQQFYGKTFAEHIFSPILNKLFAEPAEHLAVNAHLLFVSPRLIMLTPEMTRELKKSSFFDARIAFHSYQEGAADKRIFYPRQGGIERWIVLLRQQLELAGVRVLTQAEITSVELKHNRITGVVIDNSECLAVTQLVWSVSPHLLAKLLHLPVAKTNLRFRKTVLVHLIFDRPFLSEVVYVTCYDDKLATFRVTLYPNIALHAQGQSSDLYKCTVEFITDGTQSATDMVETALTELVTMGLVHPEAKNTFAHSTILPAGFPVMTNEFIEISHKLSEVLQQQADNLLILGKAKGSSFFMRDVLVDAFNEIEQRATTL